MTSASTMGSDLHLRSVFFKGEDALLLQDQPNIYASFWTVINIMWENVFKKKKNKNTCLDWGFSNCPDFIRWKHDLILDPA